MKEKDYEKEARLLIQVVLKEKASMHKLVDDATEKFYDKQNPEIFSETDDIKLIPAEQFQPLQILMQESERIGQKFGKTLLILVLEECYNTKEEMSLPEHQWTSYTKQRYESLVKTVAELLKEGKIKPLLK